MLNPTSPPPGSFLFLKELPGESLPPHKGKEEAGNVPTSPG